VSAHTSGCEKRRKRKKKKKEKSLVLFFFFLFWVAFALLRKFNNQLGDFRRYQISAISYSEFAQRRLERG